MSEVNVETEGKYHSYFINAAVEKLPLKPLETTTLTITIIGLDTLENDARLRLQNNSPGIVSMEGGNIQTHTIRAGDIKADGTYTMKRTLIGKLPGTFRMKNRLYFDLKQFESETLDELQDFISRDLAEMRKFSSHLGGVKSHLESLSEVLDEINNTARPDREIPVERAKGLLDEIIKELDVPRDVYSHFGMDEAGKELEKQKKKLSDLIDLFSQLESRTNKDEQDEEYSGPAMGRDDRIDPMPKILKTLKDFKQYISGIEGEMKFEQDLKDAKELIRKFQNNRRQIGRNKEKRVLKDLYKKAGDILSELHSKLFDIKQVYVKLRMNPTRVDKLAGYMGDISDLVGKFSNLSSRIVV
ncbi:MAG: hypothetical protein GY950_19515, partial [bacterium]|nr:hypothetical protein [bacterium]